MHTGRLLVFSIILTGLLQANPALGIDSPGTVSPSSHLGPILYVPEVDFDAGIVVRGSIITHKFVLMNIGDECLTVDLQVGLGNFEHLSLEPGEEKTVEEKESTEQNYPWLPGRTSLTICLGTNERKQTIKGLIIRVLIIDDIEVRPNRYCYCYCYGKGMCDNKEWELATIDGKDFEILGITATGNYCRGGQAIDYWRTGKTGRWQIRISKDKASAPYYSDCWYAVRTSDELQPLIHLSLDGTVCEE